MASKNTLSKSDFIRSQPTAMSAADVVDKAKGEGLKFDASLVYKVRGRANAKAKMKGGSSAKTTSKAASPPEASPAQSKAEFVRSLPSSMPARDVVAKAKALGMSLSETHVYGVRASNKTSATKKRGTRRGTASRSTAAPPASTNGGGRPSLVSSAESLLKAVAAELGLGRALEILAGERARVQAVIGG